MKTTQNFRTCRLRAGLGLAVAAAVLAPQAAMATTPAAGSDTAGTQLTPPSVSDEQKIAPYTQPGVVSIGIHWKAWIYDKFAKDYLVIKGGYARPTTFDMQCTGYIVNPDGWIGTAGHCVSEEEVRKHYVDYATDYSIASGYFGDGVTSADRDAVQAYWEDHLKTESDDSTGATAHPDRTVDVSWGASVSGIDTATDKVARVVDYQELDEGDAALLKVNESEMNALTLVPGDNTVETGTLVASIGYGASVDSVTDANYNPSFKTGSVSSQKTVGNDLLPVYEINAQVTGGMSGGPTVNYAGEVIGTNSFGIFGETQSFNFVGTSQRMLELMASQGVDNELSETTQEYERGLDAYFAGDKTAAVDALGAVVEEQPANEIAGHYLDLAQDLPDPEPAKSARTAPVAATQPSTPVAPIAGIVVGLLALVGAGVAFVMRRGTRTPIAATQHGPAAPAPAGPVARTEEHLVGDTVAGAAGSPVGFTATPTSSANLPVATAKRFCEDCGTPFSDMARFCGSCGSAAR